MTEISSNPRIISIGKISHDYLIDLENLPHLNVLGGEAVYAAAGMRLWNEFPGIAARVSADFPPDWLERLKQRGFQTRGMIPHPEMEEIINFFCYQSIDQCTRENPIRHFTQLQVPFPKPLLNYTPPVEQSDSQTQISPLFIRANEIPDSYLDATSACLGPMDYASYNTLLHVLKQSGVHNLSLDPDPGMMNSRFFDLMPDIARDILIFNTNDRRIRNLFYGQSEDLWEMAAQTGAWGAEIVIIRTGCQGYMLYESATQKRWVIPMYPNRALDPTGAESVFCGGMLAGFVQTYDPLHACLMGSIAASFKIEGISPFYPLDTLPALVTRRLEYLKESIRAI